MANVNHGVSGGRDGRVRYLGETMDAGTRQAYADMWRAGLSVHPVTLSDHLERKVADGLLSFGMDVLDELLSSFDGGHVVEVSVGRRGKWSNHRILVRNDAVSRPDVAIEFGGRVRVCARATLCAVLDVEAGCVVTAWWNDVDDHHATLDRGRYA